MMWMREFRTAARSLARRPGFSAVIMLTLALGIGANVAIFTVVDGVLLRPLPFPASERIVAIDHHAPGLDLPELGTSLGLARVYLDQAHTLASVAVVDDDARNLTGGDRPDRVRVAEVSPGFFDVVRTRPAMGRAFTEDDARPGTAPVAVLTWSAWQGRFGGDPAVVGSTVRIDGVPTDVVGVMPEGFAFPEDETAVLLPVDIPRGAPPMGAFGRQLIARVADGATVDDARREVEALQARIPEFDPDNDLTPAFLEKAGWSVTVQPLRDKVVGDVRATLWIVLGTVGFVLLIACANVANLFLVRAEGRQREVAIRAAMGAGRGRIALTFLAESLLLGLAAGALGTGLAVAGVRALVAFGPQELPRLHEIGMDGTVLAFAVALSVLAGVAFGLLPVVRYLGRSFARVLRDGDRSVTEGRRRNRVRNLLVAGQLAMALVLLVGSGLMIRSYQRLRSVAPGVNPRGVTAVDVSMGEVDDRGRATDFYRQVADELEGAPGVTAVGATNSLPLRPNGLNGGSFEIESRPRADDALPPVAMWAAATPGFFQALGIPVVEGRAMEDADGTNGERNVWVNEAFAHAFLDGRALGERVRTSGDSTWATIAGVVGDVRQFELKQPVRPLLYFPMSSTLPTSVGLTSATLVLKSAAPQAEVVTAVRSVVGRLGPEVPVTRAASMESVVARSMADTSFTMALLAIAAGVALLLGTVGVYGVIAYAVSQRTREIGVRMALGAQAGDVERMVVRQGMAVAVMGTAVGVGAAFALTRLMASILFEVSATDPLTFAVVAVALVGVALLASWLPARRAARLDPARVLSVD